MSVELDLEVPVFVQEFNLRGGSTPSSPGLPSSDRPRVTGAHGFPAYDTDFGLGSRGNAVDPCTHAFHHHSLQQMQE